MEVIEHPPNIKKEKDFLMVLINRAEKDIIQKKMPNVHIARTCKGKSNRHKYYCEENKRAMKLLKK